MPKMIKFSNADTRAIFDAIEGGHATFSELAKDVANGKKIYNVDGVEVSTAEANDKIRDILFSVCGLEGEDRKNRREVRKAIRRHKIDLFEVTEDILQDLVITGWGENPFYREYVETKSAAIGDTNEFYTPDKVILTVSELSGNHHNFNAKNRLWFFERVRIA